MDASIHSSLSVDSPNSTMENIQYTMKEFIDKKIKQSMAITGSSRETTMDLSNCLINEWLFKTHFLYVYDTSSFYTFYDVLSDMIIGV